MEGRSLDYLVLDVFATKNYEGNPLAVVFTDGDLNLVYYENIAREFGYSETSFVYYSKQEKTLQVRSFTPIGFEVDGAGHNLLGAVSAAILKDIFDFPDQNEIRNVKMKEKFILIFVSENNVSDLPVVKMLQKPASIGRTVPTEAILKALNTTEAALQITNIQPTIVQTEVAHLMVPITTIETLNSIKPNNNLLIELSKQYGFEGFYCFTSTGKKEGNIVQARFFNPLIGIDEDAATGTAAGPLAGLLYDKGIIKQDKVYQILQGVKLNQPSLIEIMVTEKGILVGGSSIITMEGKIYLDTRF